MKPHEAAAVGLFWLVLADLEMTPETVALTETDGLVRDDFELPIERIVQLLNSYAKVSHHIFHLSDVDEMPAPQNNFHFVTLTVST